MRVTIITLFAGVLFAVTSCNRSYAPAADINPLYKTLADCDTLSESAMDSLLKSDRQVIDAMFAFMGHDTVTAQTLHEWSQSAAVRIFTPAVDSIYPDISPLRQSLGNILANAKAEGLNLPQRRYAAVVWGNLKSIAISDSVMLIALNHYLGADYPGYSRWPAYARADKTPAMLPYDIVEALVATSYPYDSGGDATVLSRLLYEGALIEAKMQLVADADLATALGYTQSQLDWAEHNRADLWDMLVSRKMLFDTSRRTAEQLCLPAPSTSILEPYVPPRIGRYIGYTIVRAYIDNKGVDSLTAILAPVFYNSTTTLNESGY